ncbi:DnaJ-class molecular chaperone [Nocardiopsis mwathae]|uniref:DnaJ-class molecular chaperone n=1 Tax=Nocardiopsis mwathae TaxID=1472723 RepID=A0A7X0D5Y0_9ACTN|nr:DnaJ-class molecular chaperone [Nocardiopsis mwathae]
MARPCPRCGGSGNSPDGSGKCYFCKGNGETLRAPAPAS